MIMKMTTLLTSRHRFRSGLGLQGSGSAQLARIVFTDGELDVRHSSTQSRIHCPKWWLHVASASYPPRRTSIHRQTFFEWPARSSDFPSPPRHGHVSHEVPDTAAL